jgi:hypothetical protein
MRLEESVQGLGVQYDNPIVMQVLIGKLILDFDRPITDQISQ